VTAYSQRSAMAGSTFAARRAGSQQLNAPAMKMIRGAMKNTRASCGLTLYSKVLKTRLKTKAPRNPAATPAMTTMCKRISHVALESPAA